MHFHQLGWHSWPKADLRSWFLNSLARGSQCLSSVEQTCYNIFCRPPLTQAGVATSALNFCCCREALFDIWLGFRTVYPLKGNLVEDPVVRKAVNMQTQSRTLPSKGMRYTNSLKTLRTEQKENTKSINGPRIYGLLYLHWVQELIPVHMQGKSYG